MIRYTAFCKICETGSFTRAAEEMGYTQAAVSQMIRSLEDELSVTLFIRTRRGVELTEEGKRLFPLIEKYVLAYRDLGEAASDINGLEMGEIRIGTCSSISQRLLPPLISDFTKIYPNVTFTLMQGNNTTMPEWIKSGMIDFGFVYPQAAKELQCRIILKDPYLAVIPENHPLAEKSEVSLEELAREPLIIADEGITNTVLMAFENKGIKVSPKFRIQDDHTILSMVESGLGVSVLSSMLLEKADYRIKKLKISTPVVRSFGVTYRDRESLPISSKKFIDFMFEKTGTKNRM
ncbi:MAG: LysR family transcriptional regulator [Firmicutes bacterium]|nr:LysR family transcriptional regulator [Candidatus Colimorpha enterica]